MKKIALIQPKPPETIWNLTGTLELVNKRKIIPPCGLATIAALTPSDYEIEIVDETIEPINFDKKYDLVGITGYTLHAKRMFEISLEFRNRGILTVGGGPFCSSYWEEAKDHFDVLICGEAEYTWQEFLSEWEQGKYRDIYREEKRPDLSTTPLPRWDLVKLEHYTNGIVQTSRGCPYDCEFCDVISLFGRGNRYKPVDNILKEIEVLSENGMVEIFIADDNLIGNKKYVKELLKGLIRFNEASNKPLRYCTQVTLDIAQDEELLDLFQQARFFFVFIGIESANEESLIAADKKHNLRMEMKESVRRIQSRGIIIFGGMVVGFDTDDPDIFRLQSEFLIEAGITLTSLAMLVAYKGTKLWDRLEKEKRLINPDQRPDMFTFASQNFFPKLMTREELAEGYVRLLKEINSDAHFLKRFQSMIDQIDLGKVKRGSFINRAMELKHLNLDMFKVGWAVVRYYLFNPDKTKRKLFLSAVRIGLRKSIVCFPLAIVTLSLFKGVRDYVDKNYSESFQTL